MAARTSSELRDIADNRDAAYSIAAMEAARTELASRSRDDSATSESDASGSLPIPLHETWGTRLLARYSGLPKALREVFRGSLLITAMTTLGILIVFRGPAKSFADYLMFIGPAMIGWAIVVGILTERAYVRPVLITAAAGMGIFMLASAVVGVTIDGFPYWDTLGLIMMSGVAWGLVHTFVCDEQIRAYYQRQRS